MKQPAVEPETRVQQQAQQLHGLLLQLLQPPKELASDSHLEVELTPREVGALLLLGDRGEMIMTDLAAALDAPLSTVTRIVDRLEQKTVIERSRSDRDRRIVVVKPGRKGKMLHQAIRRHQLEMAGRMLEPLSGGEREILLELIAKMVRTMR